MRDGAGGTPKVTVFIPTWNGERWLGEVLPALIGQVVDFDFELLVIDSGSRDRTCEMVEASGARLIRIPNSEFDHGLTRNRAVTEARGDIVVLTVQDATPASNDWLATMVSHFGDPEVAGVFCNQIPRSNCSPFMKERIRNWVSGMGSPQVRHVPDAPEGFWKLDPTQRWLTAQFDNVASAVRRDFALTHPFTRRKFGEDVTWAKSAILARAKIVMEPRVAVIHSHDNSMWYEFRRCYLDMQNINNLFGTCLAPRLRDVFTYTGNATRRFWKLVRDDRELSLPSKIFWMAKAVPFAFSQNLVQFLGPMSNKQGNRGLWRLWNRVAGHEV